jgi:hypothetical protein
MQVDVAWRETEKIRCSSRTPSSRASQTYVTSRWSVRVRQAELSAPRERHRIIEALRKEKPALERCGFRRQFSRGNYVSRGGGGQVEPQKTAVRLY